MRRRYSFRSWQCYSVVAACVVLCACSHREDAGATIATYAEVSDERLVHAAAEPSQWMTHGGTYNEQRYSPLKRSTRRTSRSLGLVWFADFDTNRRQEATPLVVDGVLYVTTAWSKVYAFDAKTGSELWKYDPEGAAASGPGIPAVMS